MVGENSSAKIYLYGTVGFGGSGGHIEISYCPEQRKTECLYISFLLLSVADSFCCFICLFLYIFLSIPVYFTRSLCFFRLSIVLPIYLSLFYPSMSLFFYVSASLYHSIHLSLKKFIQRGALSHFQTK